MKCGIVKAIRPSTASRSAAPRTSGPFLLRTLHEVLLWPRWNAAIAIERRPSVTARLHAAERALADPDPAVRDQAVREAAEIVQAAYREVAGG